MPKILVFTANGNLEKLQLADEARQIRGAIGEHSSFIVIHESEPRLSDLIARLRDEKPDIVHFAGHGTENKGVCLSKNDDTISLLSSSALADIFINLERKPRIIFLNACYSANQSKYLTSIIDTVIGVRAAIDDGMARQFAATFYSFLGRSYSVKSAFNLARMELEETENVKNVVKLLHRKGTNPRNELFYAKPQILAKFLLTKKGRPEKSGDDYAFHLWLRGVDYNAESATFQLCDSTYKKSDRFWETQRSETDKFLVDDLTSYGNITIRVTLWSRNGGYGVESTLVEALRRHYGTQIQKKLKKAFEDIMTH